MNDLALAKKIVDVSAKPEKKRKSKKSLLQELEAIGVDRQYVAGVLKGILEQGKGKEKLDAAKLYSVLKGDMRDEKTAAVVANGPVMVIVGANRERMKALRNGDFGGNE